MTWVETSRDRHHVLYRCSRCRRWGCAANKVYASQLGDKSIAAALGKCCCERGTT